MYAQAQLVCVDCGSVVSEGVLDKETFGGTGGNVVETSCQRGYVCFMCFESCVFPNNILIN